MIRSVGNCLACLILIGSSLAWYGCDISTAAPGSGDAAEPEEVDESSDYTQQLQELYEKAKDAGEQVPGNMLDWAKGDVKKIGTFQYKIVTLPLESPEEITEELNTLGRDRWEVYWVEQTPDGKRFYLKKAMRSYLYIAGKASAFIPVPGAGE